MKLTVTIEVNESAWAGEYGTDRSEVRGDVVSFVKNALANSSVPMKVSVK